MAPTFENLGGVGCIFEKSTTKPFGSGVNAFDSIIQNPYYEISINAETTTETTQKGSCASGLNIETDRAKSSKYNMDLNLQDGINDIFGLGAALGQVPKLEAASRFEHAETVPVDVATGVATATWITAADTLYAYVRDGVAPGPRRVVAGVPAAGEVQITAGTATLHASDLVDSTGAALTSQAIHTVRIVTATNCRYLGADAQRLGVTEIWGVLFGPSGEKLPFWAPLANILNQPSLTSIGPNTATLTKNVSLSTPDGWNYPIKIWENSDTWTF